MKYPVIACYVPPYPIPNSSILVFPAINAPAACNLLTTVAGNGLWKPFRIAEAHVVGSSEVHMLSLIAITWPSIGDLGFPIRNQYCSRLLERDCYHHFVVYLPLLELVDAAEARPHQED